MGVLIFLFLFFSVIFPLKILFARLLRSPYKNCHHSKLNPPRARPSSPPIMKLHHFASPALALLLAATLPIHAADPVVANVVSTQRAGAKLVDISFDVSDADSDTLWMSVEISDDSGTSFIVPVTAVSGDTRISATPTPTSKALVWDASVDFNQQSNDTMMVRVIASDTSVPPGMALIPAGPFAMGDGTGAGLSEELPVHSVTISAFYLDKKEVTEALWDSVRTWALAHDYTGSGLPDRGVGNGADHPAQWVNWFTVVKWCNARSEKEGLTPVYYNEAGFTTFYRSGEAVPFPDWTANGYRLPTEAEWEKASRGGLVGLNYPWGGSSDQASDDINYGNANYKGSRDPLETLNPLLVTSPAGYYTPNQFGLHDMSGNVSEWCWDWYDPLYYDSAAASNPDPRGGTKATTGRRVMRGGAFGLDSWTLRCAYRLYNNPENSGNWIGFRSARGL